MSVVLTSDDGAAAKLEVNTVLMETTFLITGPSKASPGKISTGTGFLVGKPSTDGTASYFVLVTAAHVFDDIDGDIATINPRVKQLDGSYLVDLRAVQIRA
jgi:hypothetical protein